MDEEKIIYQKKKLIRGNYRTLRNVGSINMKIKELTASDMRRLVRYPSYHGRWFNREFMEGSLFRREECHTFFKSLGYIGAMFRVFFVGFKRLVSQISNNETKYNKNWGRVIRFPDNATVIINLASQDSSLRVQHCWNSIQARRPLSIKLLKKLLAFFLLINWNTISLKGYNKIFPNSFILYLNSSLL